jgi:DNA polymerase-3 subunit delta'
MAEGFFAAVVGQEQAVATLTAAASRPVHAYLFVGPAGSGKSAAARSFAAALLCPAIPADSACDTCRRVFAGVHPDVIEVEREGAAISIDTAREVSRLAAISPVEGSRKIIILHDFHLVEDAGPALLKTIEEPPATAVFVILAEYVPPELVTIASRCVRVDFLPLSTEQVAQVLEREGVEPARAMTLADASGRRLDRARLLATDMGFEVRRQAWLDVPDRLDGTGASAAVVAQELVGLLDSSVEPLKLRQDAERAALEERNARAASVGGAGRSPRAGSRTAKAMLVVGVAEMETRHRREQRRQRTDELRGGLATLASAYRDRLSRAAGDPRRRAVAVHAIQRIDQLGRDLQYNPGELLQLQALLTRLGADGLQ